MNAGEIFTYRFAATGRAIFYDGTEECAGKIAEAMPDANVSYDDGGKILKVAKKRDGVLLPKDIRFAYPNAYLVMSNRDARICTVMSAAEFKRNLITIID